MQHVEVGTKALVDDILRMVGTLTLVVRMVGTLTLVVVVVVDDIQQTVVGVRVDIQQMVVGVRDGVQQSVVVARVGVQVQQPVVVVHVDYQNQTCYFGHAFCCSFDCDVSYDYDHKHVWLHTPPRCHYSGDTDENDASFLHENQLLFHLVLG